MTNNLTETQQLLLDERQIYDFLQSYKRDKAEFCEKASLMKSLVFINEYKDFNWSWGNRFSWEIAAVEKENLNHHIIKDRSQDIVFQKIIDKIESLRINGNSSSFVKYPHLYYSDNKWHWLYTMKIKLKEDIFLNFSHDMRNIYGIGELLPKSTQSHIESVRSWQMYKSLTQTEREILFDFRRIENPKNIADKRYISENTLRKHKENIKKKIECKSDLELIRFADAFDFIEQLSK